jgi:ATP-dependent protease ClpP protease subunit
MEMPFFSLLELPKICPIKSEQMHRNHVSKRLLIVGGGNFAISALMLEALAEKFPLVITAASKKDKAEIRITGALYDWNNSSEEFTAKVDEFIEAGITDVDVYINSPGGDVFVGAEIENQIQRFTGAKNGIGGAIVASAATALAMSLDTFQMAENGQFMYHKPSAYIGGNEDKISSSLKLLQTLTAQYKELYSAKSTNSAEEIEANWAKGDVWLSAKEALEQKFITGVIKKTTITPDTKAMFEACGSPNIPKITNQKKPFKTMDQKILALSLGLPEDATEEQIKAKISANRIAAEKLATNETADKEKEALTATAKIEALVNGAITDKKIKADQAESMKSWAKADFAGCEAFLKAQPVLDKVSAAITPGAEGAVKDFSAMSETEQTQLAKEDPDAFKAAYFANLDAKSKK